MPRIIFKCPHIKPEQRRSAAHRENYVHYVATREGVERLDPGKAALPATERQKKMVSQLLRDFPLCRGLFEYEDYLASPTRGNATEFIARAIEDNADSLAKRENYVDYIATRPRAERSGSHGLFTGEDDPIVLSQAAEAVADHPGNVWLPIISLHREDAARLGYDNAQQWKDLLTGYAPKIAEAMKIPLSQFRWYAAFHDESHHPHVHMVCYSADGKSGFLSREGIAKVKSGLAKEIFRQELTEIYQRQTERRNALTTESQDVLRQLIAQMRDGTLENPKIERLMLELADRLRDTSSKKQYGYLKAPLKSIVDEIVDELEKDPRVAAAYDLWYQLREEVLRTYKDDLPERLPLSRQREFKRIKNIVIEEAVKLDQESAVLSPEDGADEPASADADLAEQEPPEVHDEAPPTVRWSNRYKEARRFLFGDNGLSSDFEKAHALLLEEAQSGNALAMYDLGRMFADGIGTDVDESQAQAWYAKAISAFRAVEKKRPNRYVEYRMGWMLLHGIGSEQDETAARKWFEKSARSGNKYARYQLAKLILSDAQSEPEEISQAVDWLRELAEAGSSYAQYALGKLYRDGGPVKQNAVQAVIWFSQAAEQGHEYAMYALGKMDLEAGNATAALRWFQLAAEQGNQFAQYQLGKLLLQGGGVPKDVEEAVRQFTASAEQGNQYAQYALGKLYLLGREIPQDRAAAVYWLTLSAGQGNEYAQYFLDHINDPRWISPLTSATRLLHHMGRIFRDETPPPSGGVSFVDSKLRRKIREKKIAMGHKPDDHEDQPVMSY